jgi:hypothetical protein
VLPWPQGYLGNAPAICAEALALWKASGDPTDRPPRPADGPTDPADSSTPLDRSLLNPTPINDDKE